MRESGGKLDVMVVSVPRRVVAEVLSAQEGTVEVEHVLKPLVVVMAGANEFDPYKD